LIKTKHTMINITNEDNMELMARYEDNHFDLAIVDPPYGINICYSPDGKKLVTDRKTQEGKYSLLAKEKWDTTPNEDYFKELFRVSKNQIMWGGNFFTEFIPPKQAWLVWDKMNGNSSFSDCEIAFTSFNTGLRIFRKTIETKNKIHICQKPVKLYEWILDKYAKEGDKILDTHLGSGSIALACHNRKFILVGCELDKDYYNSAVKRLKQHQQQLRLY
jgi:site-specific DNA-methyltransferase (adenine-specific)